VAAEKAEAARKEDERKAGIVAIIDAIRRLPAQYAGHDSTVLTELLQTLAVREVAETEFAEFVAEARVAIDTTASALMELRAGALAREEKARQDAEARRLEAERIAAERAALEAQKAEQDRIAAEQAEAARVLAEQQAAMLAQQRAEAKRQQDEANARERVAEQSRIEQEAAEAEIRILRDQLVAELEEQRAAFAREKQDAREAVEAIRRAAEAPSATAPSIEVQPPEPDLPGLIEAADQFADEVRPDDEEIIAVLCERFDLIPAQVVDMIARFDIEGARVRYAI